MSDDFQSPDYETVVMRAKQLGIRHIRDGILVNDAAYDRAIAALLDATNAKLDGITDCPGIEYYPKSVTTASDVRQFDSAIGSRLEAVEGPNEIDSRKDANWATDTKKCLPELRSAEPSLPFIAPSIANQLENAPHLGNVSFDVDYGNGHRYLAGRNPDAPGWGGTNSCGVYGALSWALCEVRMNSGTKPIMITETGYNSQTEVNEITQAKYLSRLPFVNLSAGIFRSYIYDLKDYVGGDGFGGDGLMHVDDTPKPAFYAIESELKYFSDSGTTKSEPLHYSIAAMPSVDHLLFVRHDGTYIVAVWDETSSWNPEFKVPTSVRPQTVTIELPFFPSTVTAVAEDDSGNLRSTVRSISGNDIKLTVDDHMTFVAFRSH